MQGLDNLHNRLSAMGGNQEQRIQKDKWKSLHGALKYSYQAATIELHGEKQRCLINPDKVKQDYDDKVISIDFNALANPGDVFYWISTNTYWLIYLVHVEEDSYFRGAIRRCRHNIHYKLDGIEYMTKAAIRGPVETKIVHNLKADTDFDEPNYTLNILIPNTQENYNFFKRYSRFMLDHICWEVQATNSLISMENVIEVNAKESFKDPLKDTDILVDANVPTIEITQLDSLTSGIRGEGLIQMYETYTYTDETGHTGNWGISDRSLVKIIKADAASIILQGIKPGVFTLVRTEPNGVQRKRELKVDSLF